MALVTTTDDITVDLLGPLQVVKSGETVAFSAPMQRALLAFLALDPGRATPVDAIVDALWECPPGRPVNLVQQLVSGVRRRLTSEVIVTRGRAYQLQMPAEAVDYTRFGGLVRSAAEAEKAGRPDRAARDLATALDLWRGPALVDLPDCPFVDPVRVALSHERDQAQLARLTALLATGRAADALATLERFVADHPLDERAAELLIRALAQLGRKADALAMYETTRTRIVEELGLDPGHALTAAQQAVLRQELPPAATPAAVLPQRRLPRPRTSLVGREPDLEQLRRLLSSGAPLVTVTGPGGVGKTRLALAHAHRVLDRRPVLFVDLTAVSDPGQVLPEVATAAGIRDTDRNTLPDQTGRILAGTSTLLVLDNFEHLLDAATDLAALLDALEPDTQVLATSRAALRINGEHVLTLETLPTAPMIDGNATSAGPAPAVTLYRQRAEAAHPGALEHSSPEVLGELCQRLDGLPLAIELAAARADLAPPELLLSELDKRFALLGTGPRDAPHRHRTLRACIDWSTDQLTGQERALFGVLAVFNGGASVPAVEDVAAAMIPDLLIGAALDKLAAHNLIRVDRTEHGPRISMLETIRDRARDELGTAHDRAAVRAAHAQHYLSVFASGPTHLMWPPTTAAQVRQWSDELPNARVALETLHQSGAAVDTARLALALWPLWQIRGEVSEAEGWVKRIAEAAGVPPELRTQILLRLSIAGYQLHGPERSLPVLQEAIKCGGHLADPAVQMRLALGEEAEAYLRGDLAVARETHRRAQAAAERSGDPDLAAEAACREVLTDADELLVSTDSLLRYARETHNDVLEMVVEANRSSDAAAANDPQLWRMGQRWGTHAAVLAATLGDREAVAVATANAAACSLLLGEDPDNIARQLAMPLDTFVRLSESTLGIVTFFQIAAALSAAGAWVEAAGLASAAERLTADRGVAPDPANALLVARFIDPLPDLLGPDAFETAVAGWTTLTWEETAQQTLQLPQLGHRTGP